MDSAEFAEWVAFWSLEADVAAGGEREPTQAELTAKITAWVASHNARQQMTRR